MVLEQIFKASWLEKRPWHAFLLGFIYAIVGIISARLIFGSNPGMMTVAFTSILLIPSLNRLLQDEENVEIRENKLNMKVLFKDHKDIFEIYIFLFLGVLLTYSVVALVLPYQSMLHMFQPQLGVIDVVGQATGSGTVTSIILNNLLVMIVCFILSLVYGAGGILFITWNASVWGVAFSYFVKQAAFFQDGNPFLLFVCLFIPFFPHMITEGFAYFSAAIVGGVTSKAVLREDMFSEKFHHIITDAWILMAIAFVIVILAAIIEVYFFPQMSNMIMGFCG